MKIEELTAIEEEQSDGSDGKDKDEVLVRFWSLDQEKIRGNFRERNG